MFWGIDLGGTKIEGVIVSSVERPEAICRLRVDTEGQKGYDHILSRVQLLVEMMKKETGLVPTTIGVGHPGVVDPQTQLLKNSNTTSFNGAPVKADLERLLGLPLQMMNDANCLALAEATLGAGRGAPTVFAIVMGTGTGGGIVINGQALYGCQGIGGEWGHNVLDETGPECYCGKRGCVETFLSGPPNELFYSQLTGTSRKLKDIADRARSGEDSAAVQTMDRLFRNFGKALAVVINIIDPHVVVLGGGLSNIPELLTRGTEETRKHVFCDRFDTKIVRNQLGDSAGVFGAAMLVA